jgi:hypothetical protein
MLLFGGARAGYSAAFAHPTAAYPGIRRVKWLIGLLVVALTVAATGLLIEAAVYCGAWMIHRGGDLSAEIRWLEAYAPVMRWEQGVERLIDQRYRERVQRALGEDRMGRAVASFQAARSRLSSRGTPLDQELIALGIEAYGRASNQVETMGLLSRAADWDDSVFVLAVRAKAPHQRYAALAAFREALDLRSRDGRPCAALGRVQWAKRGLGGTVPGLADNVEEDLMIQCNQSRRGGTTR